MLSRQDPFSAPKRPGLQTIEAESPDRGRRAKLRTLVLIRWIAIFGQLLALLVVQVVLEFDMPVVPMAAVIILSALFNLLVSLTNRSTVWLTDRQVLIHLGFDTLQLAALLGLAGGMSNPFAVLILAPVVVSAATLPQRYTLVLSCLAIAASSLMALYALPLPWRDSGFRLPSIYIGGLWVAIVLAIIFIASYVSSIAAESRRMANALFATQTALSREQQLSAIGGMAAAAAHELGSPLSTIRLVAKEMEHQTAGQKTLSADLLEDIRLLRSEAERCGEVLSAFALRQDPMLDSRSPFHRLPLIGLVEAAAERVTFGQVTFEILSSPENQGEQPILSRSPEMVHALTALIDNAAQFAQNSVDVLMAWDAEEVAIIIHDDGPGFEADILANLGDPYISSGRRAEGRPGLHMGLGIFIAQTLLSHSGARVSFSNDPSGGAEVTVLWQRTHLEQALGSRL